MNYSNLNKLDLRKYGNSEKVDEVGAPIANSGFLKVVGFIKVEVVLVKDDVT